MFPTYIHAWDGASCRQNLILNYYLLPIVLIGMGI